MRLEGPGTCGRREAVVDDLETAAAQAPLAGKIRSFAAWAGAGRKLTQTGKITLSDARHLVDLLQTGDTIDPVIGDRVFRTTSSTDLGGLTRIAEWAKVARLVRVSGNRLVPVKKNAALLDQPLDLVLALAGAYPSLGSSLFPRAITASRWSGTSSPTSATRC
jgi:hypothetical protein